MTPGIRAYLRARVSEIQIARYKRALAADTYYSCFNCNAGFENPSNRRYCNTGCRKAHHDRTISHAGHYGYREGKRAA